MGRERRKAPQRPHKPRELGPNLYRKRAARSWYADLRPWGGGRQVLRDPATPGWPHRGRTTEDRAEADRWRWSYVELAEDRARRASTGLPPAPRTLGDAIDAYLLHRRSGVEAGTLKSNKTALNSLRYHLSDRAPVEHITEEVVQGFIDERLRQGYRVTTLETYLAGIAGFAAWLGIPDLRRRVRLPNPGRMDVRTWEPEEIERLRVAASELDEQGLRSDSPSYRLCLETALATGARRNELFALRWRNFDPVNRTVRIQQQLVEDRKRFKPLKGKHGRTAVVMPGWWAFYAGHSVQLVLPGRAHGPFTAPQRLVTRLLDAAKLNQPGVGWHSFRHTYSRNFLEAGGSLEQLQKSLGHAKIRTTEDVYGHLREDVAARMAVERIYRPSRSG